MESDTIFALYMGTRCVRCAGTKEMATAFCPACYFELPFKFRDALYEPYGCPFAEVFNACIDWFKQLS